MQRAAWVVSFGVILGAFGCNQGATPDSSSAVPGDKAGPSAPLVFDARTEAPGSHCGNGGIALLSGPTPNATGSWIAAR